jgi:hypothetical protein
VQAEVALTSVRAQNFAINPLPVVSHMHREVFLSISDFHLDLTGPRMLERVP